MHFYYDYSPDFAQGFGAGMAGFMGVFTVLYYLFSFAISITMYILQASSLYCIAKRRGIHHAWLAWIPVANLWLLGCISDQYQYVAKGNVRTRRKALLGLSLTIVILAFVMGIFAGLGFASEALDLAYGDFLFGASVAVTLLSAFAMLAIAVILIVFEYMALYDLFASCDPDHPALYLIFSILFPFTEVIFLMLCRKQDKGMPARVAPSYTQPAYAPVAPYASQPEPYVPAYQPAPVQEEPPVQQAPVQDPPSDEPPVI